MNASRTLGKTFNAPRNLWNDEIEQNNNNSNNNKGNSNNNNNDDTVVVDNFKLKVVSRDSPYNGSLTYDIPYDIENRPIYQNLTYSVIEEKLKDTNPVAVARESLEHKTFRDRFTDGDVQAVLTSSGMDYMKKLVIRVQFPELTVDAYDNRYSDGFIEFKNQHNPLLDLIESITLIYRRKTLRTEYNEDLRLKFINKPDAWKWDLPMNLRRLYHGSSQKKMPASTAEFHYDLGCMGGSLALSPIEKCEKKSYKFDPLYKRTVFDRDMGIAVKFTNITNAYNIFPGTDKCIYFDGLDSSGGRKEFDANSIYVSYNKGDLDCKDVNSLTVSKSATFSSIFYPDVNISMKGYNVSPRERVLLSNKTDTVLLRSYQKIYERNFAGPCKLIHIIPRTETLGVRKMNGGYKDTVSNTAISSHGDTKLIKMIFVVERVDDSTNKLLPGDDSRGSRMTPTDKNSVDLNGIFDSFDQEALSLEHSSAPVTFDSIFFTKLQKDYDNTTPVPIPYAVMQNLMTNRIIFDGAVDGEDVSRTSPRVHYYIGKRTGPKHWVCGGIQIPHNKGLSIVLNYGSDDPGQKYRFKVLGLGDHSIVYGNKVEPKFNFEPSSFPWDVQVVDFDKACPAWSLRSDARSSVKLF